MKKLYKYPTNSIIKIHGFNAIDLIKNLGIYNEVMPKSNAILTGIYSDYTICIIKKIFSIEVIIIGYEVDKKQLEIFLNQYEEYRKAVTFSLKEAKREFERLDNKYFVEYEGVTFSKN